MSEFIEAIEQVRRERNEALDKLEAIKKFLIEKVEHYKSRTDTVPDSCYWFAYKTTLEILEGEQTSGGTE